MNTDPFPNPYFFPNRVILKFEPKKRGNFRRNQLKYLAVGLTMPFLGSLLDGKDRQGIGLRQPPRANQTGRAEAPGNGAAATRGYPAVRAGAGDGHGTAAPTHQDARPFGPPEPHVRVGGSAQAHHADDQRPGGDGPPAQGGVQSLRAAEGVRAPPEAAAARRTEAHRGGESLE